ncbi:integrin alpha-2-like [Clupea harengus]|uniref:Integrin alpha-2-like n=1 Tax=Clupea harengus TaxID=7950 RepID=A0A6P8FZR8_CLUHA|nr:integrin alpha-2-like [Clupea harengus]
MVDKAYKIRSKIRSEEDIGPEFNFMLKVSTGNLPISLVYLTISLPMSTVWGNPLFSLTGVTPAPSGNVRCDVNEVVNSLKTGRTLHSPTFIKESFKGIESLDCNTSKCQSVTCLLKNMTIRSHYSVNVTTRIWNSTFALASFQAVSLSVSADVETDMPDLLVITDKHRKVKVTLVKSGVKLDVPFVVIVGSVLGGLLLLAVVTATLWTLGFFERKHKQPRMDGGEGETD